MSLEKLSSIVPRLFFLAASVLLVLAVLERLAVGFGYTILRGVYTPGRMLEFAGILLLFAMALLLRQIREELRGRRDS
jgi:hypothetical protein